MGSYTGPVQPMKGGMAQENFGQMVDHVLSWNSKIPSQLVKRRINTWLRYLEDLRIWAGMMVRGEIRCPAAYSTGTVTTTVGSDEIVGDSTSWPHNDSVDTTLSVAITVANELQEITPASITGISMGDYLLFDEGEAAEEYVLVHEVKTSTFMAAPTQTHLANATITKSSYQGLSFKIGQKSSYATIIGISSDQRAKIEFPWVYDADSGASYKIAKAYVTMPPGLRFVWSVVCMGQNWELAKYLPQDVVQQYDAWRSAFGWPTTLINYVPDQIGRIRYELYPLPISAQGIPYIAARNIPNLEDDDDNPPTCIPSHILVNYALSDALMHDRSSEYYDPNASRMFRQEAEQGLQAAINADDSVYMQNLQWMISKMGIVKPGAEYWQGHDEYSCL
jgi:hypothetical protein